MPNANKAGSSKAALQAAKGPRSVKGRLRMVPRPEYFKSYRSSGKLELGACKIRGIGVIDGTKYLLNRSAGEISLIMSQLPFTASKLKILLSLSAEARNERAWFQKPLPQNLDMHCFNFEWDGGVFSLGGDNDVTAALIHESECRRSLLVLTTIHRVGFKLPARILWSPVRQATIDRWYLWLCMEGHLEHVPDPYWQLCGTFGASEQEMFDNSDDEYPNHAVGDSDEATSESDDSGVHDD